MARKGRQSLKDGNSIVDFQRVVKHSAEVSNERERQVTSVLDDDRQSVKMHEDIMEAGRLGQ